MDAMDGRFVWPGVRVCASSYSSTRGCLMGHASCGAQQEQVNAGEADAQFAA